jgi:hypothetical protein
MKKNLSMGAFALFFLLAMTGASMAATYVYSDLANNINYSLTLTSTGTNTYDAIFDITGVPTPPANYYASAFTFKLSGNDNFNITSLTAPAGITQPWLVADYNTNSGVQVLTGGSYKNLLESNKVGFYNFYASSGQPISSVNEVAITSSTDVEFLFSFSQSGVVGLDAIADLIAFKALYLTNDGGTVQFQGWLSQNLAAPVPEPGTMMLLGSGLVGLAAWGRKKFRK